MDFLKQNKRLSFQYGGKHWEDCILSVKTEETADQLTTVYTLSGGLVLTNVAKKVGGAYEWVNWWENTADTPTEILSAVWDCDVRLPLTGQEPSGWHSYQPELEDATTVYAPKGSTWDFDEFSSNAEQKSGNSYLGHLTPGNTKTYAPVGGRSCDGQAPFFHIHKDNQNYLVAVGWTGQWNCQIHRTEEEVIVKTKIEDTHFRLLPGEKFRTSSVVILPCEGDLSDAKNKWRRLVKEHYSLIGAPGRDEHGPLCASVWGGMKTSSVLDRIRVLQDNHIPLDYIWMDAGWYGADTQPTPDEFEGDWGSHTGDWQVSPSIHPKQLKDVSQAAHDAGYKFLLWFEPERVINTTPIAKEHPEFFLPPVDPKDHNLLLNLGNDQAWEYCYRTLSGLIEEIGIDCYRQDFNFQPLSYFRKQDAEDRQGITEIRHITGMYRLWDALLERFPHLLIDNCASGGRRIDIETLRRSIPLWRTDYTCPANYPTVGTQCHNLSFNQWLPYNGTGTGRPYDTYRMRSAYAPALMAGYTYSERDTFGDDPEKIAWLKKHLAEYLQVRPLMSEDFYPLTQVSDRTDIWVASQYHRPSQEDGFLQIFRRENAPYTEATYQLRGVSVDKAYTFTDADDGTQFTISGKQLLTEGIPFRIPQKRTAKLYFYRAN